MKKYILLAFTLAAVLGLNIYFRLFPAYFPQFKAQARDIIGQRIRWNIKQDIEKKFPELDDLAKQSMVKTNLYQYYKFKKAEIDRAIKTEYVLLKERFQDERGQTYMMELDCWHWGRYVENVVKTGHPGDQTVGGKQFDLFMFAPQGSYMLWDQFLFYLSAFLYKGFSLFKKVELFDFLFYLPLFFAAVFIAVLYMFSFRLGRHIAAVISCLFVGLSPIFLPRSCAGWFDKDILNLLFPLLVVWTYVLAYSAYSLKRRLLWVFFSSFWVGIFCFTWTHWWFIFLIIIGYEAYSLANIFVAYVSHKERDIDSLKRHLVSLAAFICFSFLWILVLAGTTPLIELYRQIKLALILNKPLMSSIWPNVYSTVQELKKASYPQITRAVGGQLLYFLSLISMLVIFLMSVLRGMQRDFRHQVIVIMILWFMMMFYAASKGIRFTVFLLVPLGISMGWIVNQAYEYFRSKNKRWPVIATLVIVATFLIINFISNGWRTAQQIYPMLNDTFYQVFTKMRDTTPRDAIVNSWWDLGDWLKVIARRRVIFDGQSQDTPQAYWMSNVLITDNEEEAVGILRMLNNGGNRAFEAISRELKDPFKSVLLLKKIILLPPEKVKSSLSEFLSPAVTEEVAGLIINKPGSAYFFVEYTMPGKISPISFLGNWDFVKVYVAQNIGKKTKQDIMDYLLTLGVDSQRVERLFQEAALITSENLDFWISGQSRYFIDEIKGRERNSVVLFDNGCIYDLREQTVYVYSPSERKYKLPRSLFFMEGDNLKEITYPDNEVSFSALIIKTPDGYRSILLDRKLAKSIFARLYFLNGKGLRHFKPFIEAQEGNNGHIRLFEIIWD